MGGGFRNRSRQRLGSLEVANKKKPGYYADGGGLYLQVSRAGTKSWIFRYTISKRTREMGLGALSVTTLREARAKAENCRKLVANRTDPIEHREAAARNAKQAANAGKSFRECAEAYIASHSAGWSNAKHADQWRNTLATYAHPVIGEVDVGTVTVSHITEILEPIWHTKTETATRVRGRIESVLDWAAVRGFRTGENPARWRGHLDQLFPRRTKVRRVKHHEALPYPRISGFIEKLRRMPGVSSAAVQFVILTGARTGEALGARWTEIDSTERVWTVPESRMKAKREHRVPLSTQALAVLKQIEPLRDDSGYVFPSPLRAGQQLSDMSLLVLVKRLAGKEYTTHGFRSSFRDWAAEQTNFPRDAAEAALAHTIRDKTEAAYRRGDLFEKRRTLMQAWADYCSTAVGKSGTVVPLSAKRAKRV
jgi:integrase